MHQRAFALAVLATIFMVGVAPVVMMFYETSTMQTSILQKLFETKSSIESFWNSLLLSGTVALATTSVGLFLGILFGKFSMTFSKIFLLIFIVPLLLPPYIIALGWIDIIGVNGFLSELLFGFWGVAWVLFSVYLPIPILLTLFFLKQVNPQLEEVALLCTTELQVLKMITIPIILPAVILSFLLVFILTFGEYSVANVLRYSVFPLESFVQFSAFYDFDAAIIMAMPMLLVALFVLAVEEFYLKKRIATNKSFHVYLSFKLTKREESTVLLLLVVLVLTLIVLPLLTLFTTAGSFENIYTAFQRAYDPLSRSLIFATAGGFMLMVLGFLAGYVIQQKLPYISKIVDISTLLLFILPSTVLGIAMILFWNRPILDFVYTSVAIVIFGYIAKYLALTVKISQQRLAQIPPSFLEAAAVSGANWLQSLRFILLPLSKKALIVSFIIGFIFSIRENTMTMLIYPPGLETLPVYIITQMANGKEEIIASLAVLMILTVLVPFTIAAIVTGRQND